MFKDGPNAFAMHVSVSAAAFRAAHSVFSSSSNTHVIIVANTGPVTTPGTFMG